MGHRMFVQRKWATKEKRLRTTALDASFVPCVKCVMCCRGIFSFFRKYDFFLPELQWSYFVWFDEQNLDPDS